MANEALDNPTSNFVLIIDEINRANLSSVLGELIYALEYRFSSEDEENDNTVESLYDKGIDKALSDRILRLPTNLYIIGTMNTADRSVGHIDYAIRRRFAFIEMLPKALDIKDFQIDAFKQVSTLFIKNIDEYIKDPHCDLEKSIHLSQEFLPEEVWIGHSYFISDDDGFDIRLKYEIIPILQEYIKDGILNRSASDIFDTIL